MKNKRYKLSDWKYSDKYTVKDLTEDKCSVYDYGIAESGDTRSQKLLDIISNLLQILNDKDILSDEDIKTMFPAYERAKD